MFLLETTATTKSTWLNYKLLLHHGMSNLFPSIKNQVFIENIQQQQKRNIIFDPIFDKFSALNRDIFFENVVDKDYPVYFVQTLCLSMCLFMSSIALK